MKNCPRCRNLKEARASQSQRTCAADSSASRHLSHMGSFSNWGWQKGSLSSVRVQHELHFWPCTYNYGIVYLARHFMWLPHVCWTISMFFPIFSVFLNGLSSIGLAKWGLHSYDVAPPGLVWMCDIRVYVATARNFGHKSLLAILQLCWLSAPFFSTDTISLKLIYDQRSP
jgi:hypothetical protein